MGYGKVAALAGIAIVGTGFGQTAALAVPPVEKRYEQSSFLLAEQFLGGLLLPNLDQLIAGKKNVMSLNRNMLRQIRRLFRCVLKSADLWHYRQLVCTDELMVSDLKLD